MAHFIGYVSGKSRTEASRLGSPSSGIIASANGWKIGVSVCGRVNERGEDEFSIYLTGGSNRSCQSVSLGVFTRSELEKLLNEKV